jgi:hypothetical protein
MATPRQQIALFVIPVITLAGWVIDQPMDLNFRIFDTVLLVLTILIVNMTLGDGKSNWLEVLYCGCFPCWGVSSLQCETSKPQSRFNGLQITCKPSIIVIFVWPSSVLMHY